MGGHRTSNSRRSQLEGLGNRSGLFLVDQPAGYSGRIENHHGGKAMSATHTVLGSGILLATLQAVWMAIGPAPPPITVHSLTYDAGYIIQDRTVSWSAWVAEWKAEIVEDRTGAAVPNCAGGGFWTYPGGRVVPRISLTEWVGNDACVLPTGRYFPRATYWDGEFRAVVRGDVFEVTG